MAPKLRLAVCRKGPLKETEVRALPHEVLKCAVRLLVLLLLSSTNVGTEYCKYSTNLAPTLFPEDAHETLPTLVPTSVPNHLAGLETGSNTRLNGLYRP